MDLSPVSNNDDSDLDTRRQCSRVVSFVHSDKSIGDSQLFVEGHSTSFLTQDHDNNSLNENLDSIHKKRESEDEGVRNEILAKKQTRALFCLRSFTGITLITSAILICTLTFVFSRKKEVKEYEYQYNDVIEAFENTVKRGLQNTVYSAKTLSAVYTSVFGPQNVWPNTTLNDFDKIADGQSAVANSLALSFNPIITSENRAEFEAHAAQNWELLGVSELQNNFTIFRRENGVVIDDPGIQPDSVFPNVMIPVYQIYPAEANRNAIMYNVHSEKNRMRALDDMLLYKVPTLTALLQLVIHPDTMNPSSILFYPVFSRFDNNEVVGCISIVFTWETLFEAVLTEDYEGLTVVLESSVSDNLDPANGLPRQLWTYELIGGKGVTFTEGDLHDPAFDDYEHVISTNVAQGLSGLEDVDNLITFKIRLYPSLNMKNYHITDEPMTFSLVLFGIFIFVSIVFFAYDRLQIRQKNKIMSLAKKSGEIVDSLFPISVKERLFNQSEHINKQATRRNEMANDNGDIQSSSLNRVDSNSSQHSPVKGGKNMDRFKRFLRRMSKMDRGTSQEFKEAMNSPLTFETSAIADLFPETSIMFADVVGFTKWSSDRAPEDVFHFLETLFFEFDKIGDRLGVFKLGTIGDCYIAVTGIPDYQPDHAVIMCQFAHECRLVMKRVFQELDQVCGDTDDLSMRFGIHSGPVTAGVLRGKKSRFELFGDTINTGSRIESTSIPGMIQISQTTANYLIDAGLSDWFEPRDDKVQAKGKGELQTYWLSIDGKDKDEDVTIE
jgi:class 3 adenylate cyclase